MSRYHYSRNAPHSATHRSESLGPRQYSSGHLVKPTATLSTTASSSNLASPGSMKSNYIPLVRSSRSSLSDKRDFIPIPIKREDGAFTTNPGARTIPITFLNETTSLLPDTSRFIRDLESPPRYASLLRPSPKYSQSYSHNNYQKDDKAEPIGTVDTLTRLPAVSRRLSLTIPVMTTTTTSTSTADEDAGKPNVTFTPVRPAPIRLSQPSSTASIPTHSTRLSSAIVRSSPSSNPLPIHLQRQKSDLVNSSSSSDFTSMPVNASPVRRAEVMAREAIQGIARYQQHQPHQTPVRKNSLSDNNPDSSGRSPLLSRRVIVNLKNNQSVSLDSRVSSTGALPAKPSTNPSSSRPNQRNNLYHIPVLHEIQVPPHPANVAAENFFHFPRSATPAPRPLNNYKNEFRMEIPVTVVARSDQENFLQQNFSQANGMLEYDPQMTIISDRRPSLSSRHTLKSILKRSASRDNVLRKNVSFMNA